MGAHLIDGQFQSDKYPATPRGKVPLSVRDLTAQDLLWEYARRRRAVDAEFSDDLETALRSAGYVPGVGDLVRAEQVEARLAELDRAGWCRSASWISRNIGELTTEEEREFVRLRDERRDLDVPDAAVDAVLQKTRRDVDDVLRLAREVKRRRAIGARVTAAGVDGVDAGVSGSTGERDRLLRETIRSQVAYYLQEDVDGGELYKETWEACADDRDREVVRAELRVLISQLSGDGGRQTRG